MCHFPFKYMNTTYTSCSHAIVPNFNLEGEPWCATKVEPDGITVQEYKLALCQDERGLILDGSGKYHKALNGVILTIARNFGW